MLEPEYRPRAAYDVESIVTYMGHILKSPPRQHALGTRT